MKILSGLTGLRGLAALIVVFYHLNQHRSTEGLSYFSWGMYQFTEHLALVVSVFFILGGLLRSLSYWKVIILGEERVPQLLPSLFDRFRRIAPMYYLALVVTFILVLIFQGYSSEGLLRLLSGFSFLSWVSPVTFFPVEINGPLWFIAYDMMGWLLVSVVMMGTLKVNRKLLPLYFSGIVGLLLVAHFAWIQLPWTPVAGIAGEWFPTYNPFLFGLHFLAGALAGGAIIWIQSKKITPRYMFDGASLVALLALVGFLWIIRNSADWDYSWPHGPYHFPTSTLFFAVLFVALPFTRYIGKWFDNAVLRFFATISYPLYLFHMLVIVLLRKYVFLGEQLSFGTWTIFSLVTLGIASLVSWVLVEIFEKKKKA